MGKIVEWKGQGYSYYDIARHLLVSKVRTADGGECSPSRVRRVFLAAINGAKVNPIKSKLGGQNVKPNETR